MQNWPSNSTPRGVLLALMYLGTDGLPPLLAVVTNRTLPVEFRCDAIERVGATRRWGADASSAVPALLGCLQDDEVAAEAARALGNLALEPRLAVPALTEALQSTNLLLQARAAGSLGDFGGEARAAVPSLLSALEGSPGVLGHEITNALMRIAPEVLATTNRVERQGN